MAALQAPAALLTQPHGCGCSTSAPKSSISITARTAAQDSHASLASVPAAPASEAVSCAPGGRAASRVPSARLANSRDSALPVFDLAPFLSSADSRSQDTAELCMQLADCLHRTGCLVVRDPRVGLADNERFLDLMERYFCQSTEAKLADTRPQLHYQVGVTPEGIELPRCTMDPACLDTIQQQPAEHRATVPAGPDPKWRYMWRVGQRPKDTQYKELNAEPVVPQAFPEWPGVMNGWGEKMLAAVETVAAMAAAGFGLPRDAFTQRMHLGPHLLAPTGADLEVHNQLGTCYAGYHYDLNFLTIHGKSRFPGLFVWLRDGQRVPVRIPDGCLFLQAGKQMEWLTGGHVRAGMHEVISTEATQAAIQQAKAYGRATWRVSSTMFAHIASDEVLQPLGPFASGAGEEAYPPIVAGDFVQRELEAIKLKAPC